MATHSQSGAADLYGHPHRFYGNQPSGTSFRDRIDSMETSLEEIDFRTGHATCPKL